MDQSGRLRRNGEMAKPRDKVAVGDLLVLTPEYDDRVEWGPEHLPLDVLYEDEHVIVLNKPVGLVVHRGSTQRYAGESLARHAPDNSSCLVAVSCIDWIKIFGHHARGSLAICSQITGCPTADRTVAATAVCRGTFTGGGTIDGPIGRHPTRTKMAVVPDGRPAITHYRIAERFAPIRTLMSVWSRAERTKSACTSPGVNTRWWVTPYMEVAQAAHVVRGGFLNTYRRSIGRHCMHVS